VIIRKDLSTSQQAVQAGHALAEHLLHGRSPEWKNHILIYLGVKDLFHLERIMLKFEMNDIPYTKFHEPDLNNEVTAIVTDHQNKIIEKLNLL